MFRRLSLTFRLDNRGPELVVTGRNAWALRELTRASESGCTPLDTPGPRWSGYVFNLRALGIEIETIHETHGGPFPGTDARYVLRSQIELMERVDGKS